jgi:uncharacterized protein YunC (DUF1805 family)/predicted amino acid-binding ACT domain protein
MAARGSNVGSAYVSILPNMDEFDPDLRRKWDELRANLRLELPVTANLDQTATKAKIKEQIRELQLDRDLQARLMATLNLDQAKDFAKLRGDIQKLQADPELKAKLQAYLSMDEAREAAKIKAQLYTLERDQQLSDGIKLGVSLDEMRAHAAVTELIRSLGAQASFNPVDLKTAVNEAQVYADLERKVKVAEALMKPVELRTQVDNNLIAAELKREEDQLAAAFAKPIKLRTEVDNNLIRNEFERTGADAGSIFAREFENALNSAGKSGGGSGGGGVLAALLPGGSRGSAAARSGLLAAGTLAVPGLAAGLMGPIVGAIEAALPMMAGLGATALVAKSDISELTSAFQALSTQTDKYNTLANTTQRFFASTGGYSAQAQATNLLTAAQQAALKSIGATTSGTKQLTAAQSTQVQVYQADIARLTGSTHGLTAAQQTQIAVYQAQIDKIQQTASASGQLTATEQARIGVYQADIQAINNRIAATGKETATQAAEIARYQAEIQAIQGRVSAGGHLTATQQAEIAHYQALITQIQDAGVKTSGLSAVQQAQVAHYQALIGQIEGTSSATGKLTAAQSGAEKALAANLAVIQGYTPAQAQVVKLLNDQNVSWGSLTQTQQDAVIQLRETPDLYKSLTNSQQGEVNALLAEKAQLDALSPAQANAVMGLQDLQTNYQDLQQAVEPQVFGLLATAERTAADALQPLQPLVIATTGALKTLFDRLDAAIQGPGYKQFIADMTGQAPKSILGFGTAVGNIALGFYHIGDALSKMANPFLNTLDHVTQSFRDWATTPRGLKDLQDFMDRLSTNQAGTFELLKNLGTSVAFIFSTFSANRMTLELLNTLSSWIVFLIRNPLTRPIAEFGLMAAAIAGLAKSIGLLNAVKAGWTALVALGRINAATAATTIGAEAAAINAEATAVGRLDAAQGIGTITGAGGAASAAEGAAASAGANSGLLIAGRSGAGAATQVVATDAAEISALEGATAAEAVGFSGKLKGIVSGLLGNVRDAGSGAGMVLGRVASAGGGLGGALGLAGAIVGIGTAITIAANDARQKADAAAGVIEHGVGAPMTAAATVAGVQVSQGFRDLANGIAQESKKAGTDVATSGEGVQTRIGQYRQDFSSQNDALKATMDLGKTQLGQTAALFVASWGGDVASMAKEVQASGNTLDQQVSNSLTEVFTAWGEHMPGYWSGLAEAGNGASKAAFDSMEKQSGVDYGNLQKAMQQYEDDLKSGRQDKAQQDSRALMGAINGFMTDANSGNIDTANIQIGKLGGDISKFFQDAAKGDSIDAQADIKQMAKDVSGQFQASTQDMALASSQALTQTAQQYAQTLQQEINHYYPNSPAGQHLHNSGFAAGGLLQGPGSGTSDSMLIRASTGEFVVNAAATKAHLSLLHAINNSKGYANGGIVGMIGSTAESQGTLDIAGFLLGMKQITDLGNQELAAAQAAAAAASVSGVRVNLPGSVAQWLTAALAFDNAPGSWLSLMELLVQRESGGNPNAVNPTPVMGEHATGLLQMLPSTFRSNMVAGHTNILNPIDNAIASIRYIERTYGSPGNIPGLVSGNYQGYDSGGIWPSGTLGYNTSGMDEGVLTGPAVKRIGGPAAVKALNSGGGTRPLAHVTLQTVVDGKVFDERVYKIIEDFDKQLIQFVESNAGAGG